LSENFFIGFHQFLLLPLSRAGAGDELCNHFFSFTPRHDKKIGKADFIPISWIAEYPAILGIGKASLCAPRR
jgi:hypothetical protein